MNQQPIAPLGLLLGRAQFHLERREFFAAEPLLTRCLERQRLIATGADARDEDPLGLIALFLDRTDLHLAQSTLEFAESPAHEALQMAKRE